MTPTGVGWAEVAESLSRPREVVYRDWVLALFKLLILKGTLQDDVRAYLIFVASISSGASVKKITERNFFDDKREKNS